MCKCQHVRGKHCCVLSGQNFHPESYISSHQVFCFPWSIKCTLIGTFLSISALLYWNLKHSVIAHSFSRVWTHINLLPLPCKPSNQDTTLCSQIHFLILHFLVTMYVHVKGPHSWQGFWHGAVKKMKLCAILRRKIVWGKMSNVQIILRDCRIFCQTQKFALHSVTTNIETLFYHYKLFFYNNIVQVIL